MWLADVQTQLVSNLEKPQKWYKENVDEDYKNNLASKLKTKLGFNHNISR